MELVLLEGGTPPASRRLLLLLYLSKVPPIHDQAQTTTKSHQARLIKYMMGLWIALKWFLSVHHHRQLHLHFKRI
jgi:hypothetical protein